MVFGIGVDLVHVKRIEHILHRWGERFVSRLFTSEEKKICYSRPRPASAFAMRFAAKEAFSKALGLGMRMGVRWRDIEVFHFPGGKPGLKIHGASMDICRDKEITGFHVSLTDDGDYAIAMVVLETRVDLVQSS